MSKLLGLLGNPWVLLVSAGVIFVAGLTLGVYTMAGKLSACGEKVGQFRSAYDHLAALSQEQNKKVNDLGEATKKARERGRQAVLVTAVMVKAHEQELAHLRGLLARPEGKTCSQAYQELKEGIK